MTSTDEFVLAEEVALPPAPKPARRPLLTQATTWVVVGLVLILVGVLAAPTPQQPRLDDGVAWNVLELDLASQPEVIWTRDVGGGQVLGQAGNVVLLSMGVASGRDGPSGETILAIDADTGADRWQITSGTCTLSGDVATCVEGSGSPDAMITVTDDRGQADPVPYPGAMRAQRLDDGGLLVVEGGTTALAQVVRLAADGTEIWRSALGFSGLADIGWTGFTVAGDVAILNNGGAFALDDGDRAQDGWGFADVDQNDATRRYVSERAVLVTLPSGSTAVVPAGDAWLTVDDAFGGPVALTRDEDTMTVVDADSSYELQRDPGCWPAARLLETILVACHDHAGTPEERRLLGIDQRTGTPLWEGEGRIVAAASADTILLMTDAAITAIDPRTGAARWALPATGPYLGVTALDDGLLVSTMPSLIRLG